MLRSYLPGLGLSAAVVAAALAIYSLVSDGSSNRGPGVRESGQVARGGTGPVKVQLPPVPPAQEPGVGGSVDEGESGPAITGLVGELAPGISVSGLSGGLFGQRDDLGAGGETNVPGPGEEGGFGPGSGAPDGGAAPVGNGGVPQPQAPVALPGVGRRPFRPAPSAGLRPATPRRGAPGGGKAARPDKTSKPIKLAKPETAKGRAVGHSKPSPPRAVGHSAAPRTQPATPSTPHPGNPHAAARAKPPHPSPPPKPESQPQPKAKKPPPPVEPAPPAVAPPPPPDDCDPAGHGNGNANGRC